MYWQDQECRFNLSKTSLACISGERIVSQIHDFQSKTQLGSNSGSLTLTNLRLIWQSTSDITVNISIGLNTIQNIHSVTANNKFQNYILLINCITKSKYFDFTFEIANKLVNQTTTNKFIESLLNIQQSYDSTRSYREIKIRGEIFSNLSVCYLTNEEKYELIPNIKFKDGGNMTFGSFIITNVRIIWYSQSSYQHNMSIPFYSINTIYTTMTQERVLIIKTNSKDGKIFEFFGENTMEVEEILKKFHNIYIKSPCFGIDYRVDTSFNLFSDEYEVPYDENIDYDALIYLSENQRTSTDDIRFSNMLGLAIEKTPEDIGIENLWKIR